MGKNRKRKRSHETASSSPKVAANPLLDKQRGFLKGLSRSERDNFFSARQVDPDRRAQLWMDQAYLGESLVNRYSWATPDDRALRILKHFSPIVEIGCGAQAYWCRLMEQSGIDVVGYDIQPESGGSISHGNKVSCNTTFRVQKGGPAKLDLPENHGRTLLLCYADEDDECLENEDEEQASLGSACLEHYRGDYVIHVGELFGDSLSMDQAPWGRSSSPEFQQRLAAEYHCVLRVDLTSWLHVRDTLSVWKRSETCTIVFATEDDDDGEDEEVEYRYVVLSSFVCPTGATRCSFQSRCVF